MAAKLLSDEFRQNNVESRVEPALFFERLSPYADGDRRMRDAMTATTIRFQARSICRAAASAPDVQVLFLHRP
jgi:hypothetical protein